MSKGKFEPGKRVLLLDDGSPYTEHLVGTEQMLGDFCIDGSIYYSTPIWFIQGQKSTRGADVVWKQKYLILLDPDETPEQSADAMRDLMQTKKDKETT